MTVQRPAIDRKVLKLARRRVAGPGQDEQALALLGRHPDERRDPVRSKIGVDRQGIHRPGWFRPARAGSNPPEIRLRIRLGRRADVVPLAVHDDDQAAILRACWAVRMQRQRTLRAVHLVEGGLELDHRDEPRHGVDHLAPKSPSARATPGAVARVG